MEMLKDILFNNNQMQNNINDDYSIDYETGMNNNSNNSHNSNSNNNIGFKMNDFQNNANLQIFGQKNPQFSYDLDINDYFLKLNHLNLYEGFEDLLKKYLNSKEYSSKDFTEIYNKLNIKKDIKMQSDKKDINEYIININLNDSDSDENSHFKYYAPNNKIIEQVNEFNKTNVDKKIDIKQNKNENKDNKSKENKNLMKMYAAEKLNNNDEDGYLI